MRDTGFSPLSSLYEKRKQPTSKKQVSLSKISGVKLAHDTSQIFLVVHVQPTYTSSWKESWSFSCRGRWSSAGSRWSSAGSAYIPFILKGKLKFFLQVQRQVQPTYSSSWLKFFLQGPPGLQTSGFRAAHHQITWSAEGLLQVQPTYTSSSKESWSFSCRGVVSSGWAHLTGFLFKSNPF